MNLRTIGGGALAVALALTLATVTGADAAELQPSAGPLPCPGNNFPATTPPAKGQLVVPVDTSTSTVINPGQFPQVGCGGVALRTVADVTYVTRTLSNGQQLPLRVDLLIPQTPGRKPLVLYIPGGGFVSADKGQAATTRTYLAEAGFVVASVEYRTALNAGSRYVDGVADLRTALKYLRVGAGQYSIDPNRVAVLGQSAGGYLANLLGTAGPNDIAAGDGPGSNQIQAVVDFFGGSDLSKLLADFDPTTQSALAGPENPIAWYVNGQGSGKSLADAPDEVRKANPITYIGDDPAFLHFHGAEDRIISPSQTLLIHNALRAAGEKSKRYIVNGAGHGDLEMPFYPGLALPWTTPLVLNTTVAFLRAELR
jgi:acetyl esterase/lipase